MLSEGGSKFMVKQVLFGSRIPLNQYLRFCPNASKKSRNCMVKDIGTGCIRYPL